MIADCKLQTANCRFGGRAARPRLRGDAVDVSHAAHADGERGHGSLYVSIIGLALSLSFAAPVYGGSSEAAVKVREGLAQFRAGDFKSAAEAFSAAGEAMPDELRIAFDRGCAYAAAKDYDKAVEQFQKAAAAPDHSLAALAHYNLGSAEVARAKDRLGPKPEDAEGEARTSALEFLARGVRHYRDCLNIDVGNDDARYNLETIRLWIKYIQDVWQERDRQKRRAALNLLEHLQWLEGQERDLRRVCKELEGLKASPRQREAVRAAEIQQRSLADEIDPLKDKIASSLAMPQQQPGKGMAASPGPDVQKAIELLSRLADDVRQSMDKAAERLAGQSLAQAAEPQSQAIETIDQIFMAVAPYANLVERGIGRQEGLIGQSPATAHESDAQAGASRPQGRASSSDAEAVKPQRAWSAPYEGVEAAWNQRFVARYGRILSAKARRELEQLESSMPAAKEESGEQSAALSGQGGDSAATQEKNQSAPEEEQLKVEKQRRDLKEALQLGIQSAPVVERLAEESALLLEENKPGEALPKQQEALKLLKEMLPKQEQQDKDKHNQEKKNQDKKEQDKKEQDKQNGGKRDQQQKDQEKQDQEKKGQDKQDRQDKDKQKQQSTQQEQQKQRDLSKEQAEAVLRKARQREDQYREIQKAYENYLYRPEKVEKDW
jgi:hypothetical protein